MADTAPIDDNSRQGLIAASSADGKTPVRVYADPTSHRLLVTSDAGVVGPGSSTDNAVVRFDGTTGETLQNSVVVIDDSGVISGATGAALTRTSDTNVTLTLGGAPTTALLTAASVTAGWTGTLAVSRGGTGAATLTGAGIPTVTSADLTAQGAAVASVVTVTAPNDGSSHTYSVGGYITVTAISVNTITLQVTYTDETSASRTQSFFGEGLTTAAVSTTGGFAFPPMTIRAAANTAITVLTTIVGVGSETYDVGGYIMRIN